MNIALGFTGGVASADLNDERDRGHFADDAEGDQAAG
jgi:hypothetical protein